MLDAFLALAVFVVAYVSFIVWPHARAWLAIGAGLLLVALGIVPARVAVTSAIPWPVLTLMTGMMVLSALFEHSRMPAVIAETLVDRTRTARGAMLALCLVASLFSTVLDNVSVVLLLAPVVLSLTRKIGANPIRPLVAVALCANLQGTATLIGDPPRMLMAGRLGLSFNDFFFYRGRLAIFWAVQAGAAASFLVLRFLLRHEHRPVAMVERERCRSNVPSLLLGALVAVLAAYAMLRPGFGWGPALLTLCFAAAGGLWYLAVARWDGPGALVRSIDFRTLGFLLGMFILVQGLERTGWLLRLANAISNLAGGSALAAFVGIVTIAVLVSAVVDNVPFLLAMLPVSEGVAAALRPSVPEADALLSFGLLIGACLGGNITPIGASANVVAMGLLRREGHVCRFLTFVGIGLPFTLAAVGAGAVFIWMVWAH